MIRAKFLNRNGYDSEPIRAREKGLVEGCFYNVVDTDIGRCSSEVYLEGINYGFNSVMFEYYDEDNNEIDIIDYYMDEYN